VSNLADIPSRTQVFIDTNIFVLYYGNTPTLKAICQQFLERTTRQELQGYTSVTVVAETIHRIMVTEAAAELALSSRETVEYLQKHPNYVRKLTKHTQVASDIYHMGINILPVTYKHLHGMKRIQTEYGLLTNDALIAAVMKANKLQHLATHDAAFSRVGHIRVWDLG
jgi:predicted nucleic acid-binding protein